jgi:hypothetical protein
MILRWLAHPAGTGPVAVVIGPRGPAGPPGPPGSPGSSDGEPLVHTQSSASTTWLINHNFGFRPLVTVLSPGGAEVGAEVEHVSVNQVRISFAEPRSGSAIVR